MTIQNWPTGNRQSFEMIQSFRPAGSNTVVWAQDMGNRVLLRMLRWGNEIYLPVTMGMRLGIGIWNGNSNWRAYPTFLEARNLWDNGESDPDICHVDHMWELAPGDQQLFYQLGNPNAQLGRPLIITKSGYGEAIGENAFGSTKWRGQIRIYERTVAGNRHQYDRPTNEGDGMGGAYVKGFDPLTFEANLRDGSSSGRRGSSTPKGGAAIGAGAEEHMSHARTGLSYNMDSQPVVFLRTEFREDLLPLLRKTWNFNWDWTEPVPTFPNWWDRPWNWRPDRPLTAPEIPVIRPHDPDEKHWR